MSCRYDVHIYHQNSIDIVSITHPHLLFSFRSDRNRNRDASQQQIVLRVHCFPLVYLEPHFGLPVMCRRHNSLPADRERHVPLNQHITEITVRICFVVLGHAERKRTDIRKKHIANIRIAFLDACIHSCAERNHIIRADNRNIRALQQIIQILLHHRHFTGPSNKHYRIYFSGTLLPVRQHTPDRLCHPFKQRLRLQDQLLSGDLHPIFSPSKCHTHLCSLLTGQFKLTVFRTFQHNCRILS